VEERKHFFFEKKKQKTFDSSGFGLPGKSEAKLAKVFWFSPGVFRLFSKKNPS
jgi:hypothetical protein